jgi:Zn-dependent protease
MVRFLLFGFPVEVQPLFWLIAFLLSGGLGMLDSRDWLPVLERMTSVFVSLMAHELGHALAVRRLGGQAAIVIHTFGGTTFFQQGFDRKESIIISAAGPVFSLALAALAAIGLFVIPVPAFLREITVVTLWINCIWTAFNLLPVMPMDGGQILRDVLGARHFRLTCIIGMAAAVLAGVAMFYYGLVFGAVLLGFMAYANFKGTLRSNMNSL